MPDLTPERRILAAENVDRVAEAVLALARELWVLNDRVRVLEAVLEQKGLDVSAEIERFEPDAAMQQKLDAARDRIIDAVAGALAGD